MIAALLLIILHADSGQANHTGGMDAMSVDMDPAATPANTGTSLGSREASARVNENNTLDADEDVVDGILVDITATNVPASNPMTGFQYTLNYGTPPAPNLCVSVQDNQGLLFTDPSSTLLSVSDQKPDCDGSWNAIVIDTGGGNPESGSGFLDRLTITTNPGVISGAYAFTLTNAGHYKESEVFAADTVNGAMLCINQMCQDIEVTSATVSTPGSTTPGSFFDVFVDAGLRNDGPATLVKADVTATLNLPSGCNAVGGSVRMIQDQLLFASTDFNMARQTFSVACVEPGTHSVTATVSVVEDDPAVVEDNLSNNSATSTPVSTSVIGTSDMVVTKLDSVDPVEAGSNFSYVIRARNNGPHAARGLVITDFLPDPADGDGRGSTTFVSASVGLDYDGDGVVDVGGVDCEPGFSGPQPNPAPPPTTYNSAVHCSITPRRTDSLPVNGSAYVTVTVTAAAAAGTNNVNIATASFSSIYFGEGSPSVDPDLANEADCAGAISSPANMGCEATGTIPVGDNDNDGIPNNVDPDDDNDRVYDADENNCGGDSLNAGHRPERVDGVFAAIDDDGDTFIDEALPAGSGNFDCDGDGYSGSAEDHVYNGIGPRNQDACGTNGWPADLASTGPSTNKISLTDLSSFVAVPKKLNTSPGDSGYDVRWDLVPGGIGAGKHIILTDMSNITTLRPPMLGGVRAFGGAVCPWAS